MYRFLTIVFVIALSIILVGPANAQGPTCTACCSDAQANTLYYKIRDGQTAYAGRLRRTSAVIPDSAATIGGVQYCLLAGSGGYVLRASIEEFEHVAPGEALPSSVIRWSEHADELRAIMRHDEIMQGQANDTVKTVVIAEEAGRAASDGFRTAGIVIIGLLLFLWWVSRNESREKKG